MPTRPIVSIYVYKLTCQNADVGVPDSDVSLSLLKYALQVLLDDACGLLVSDMPPCSGSLLLLRLVELLAAFLVPKLDFLLFQPLAFVVPHPAAVAATVLVAQHDVVSLPVVLFQFSFALLTVPAVVASAGSCFELQHDD